MSGRLVHVTLGGNPELGGSVIFGEFRDGQSTRASVDKEEGTDMVWAVAARAL